VENNNHSFNRCMFQYVGINSDMMFEFASEPLHPKPLF
jgi:hypothetical protein